MSLRTSSCWALTEGQLEEVEGVGGGGEFLLLSRPSSILLRASELGFGGLGGGEFFFPRVFLASRLGLLGLTGGATSSSATASTTNL